jgi:hypothetical protein
MNTRFRHSVLIFLLDPFGQSFRRQSWHRFRIGKTEAVLDKLSSTPWRCIHKCRYCSTVPYFGTRRRRVDGFRHRLLLSGKFSWVATEQEARWTSETVWTPGAGERFWSCRKSGHGRSAQVAAVPTELPQIQNCLDDDSVCLYGRDLIIWTWHMNFLK